MNRLPNDRPPCPRLTSHTIETPLPECRHKRTCPPDRPMSAEPPAVQLAGYRIAGRMPCPDEDRNAGRIVRGGPDRMAQCRRPYRPPAARRTVDPVPDHSCIASCVWSKCVRGITNSGSEAPSHGRTEKSNGPRKERRLPKRPLPVRPVLPRCCPPPRAELYRRDLVGIVVAAGPRHRTRGPVGHDEKEPPPDRRDIRCGRSVRHRALHPVRAAHRAGPHIRRPSPASVCKAPYPLCTPARVGTSEPIPGRMPPLQPMCRTPRLTVAPVRASSSALKEQPPILSAFAAGRAENRKRTAVRLSGRMLRGNRWRSVETPQFAMLEISVPVFAERCHPCPVSSSLALAAGPVPYASGGSSRTRAGRSPAEPGARRQKQ